MYNRDPLKLENVAVFAACLLETQNFGDLYNLCYLLTENYPENSLTFYAVGLHYFLSRNFEFARKFFKKANSLDKNNLFAWLAIGHSFAVQDESDHVLVDHCRPSRSTGPAQGSSPAATCRTSTSAWRTSEPTRCLLRR